MVFGACGGPRRPSGRTRLVLSTLNGAVAVNLFCLPLVSAGAFNVTEVEGQLTKSGRTGRYHPRLLLVSEKLHRESVEEVCRGSCGVLPPRPFVQCNGHSSSHDP